MLSLIRCMENGKKEKSCPGPFCCLSAASSECRCSPAALSHWEAWLGWLYGTWSVGRISQPRAKTVSLLPWEESIAAIFASSKEFESTEILHSCWFYVNWIHVRPLSPQCSFLFGMHVNSDFPVLLPQASDENWMMFPFLAVYCYTSPPDFYFTLTKIPSLAIGVSNQMKSHCTSASSQATQPYKTLLPCLFFHCFTCCL